MRQLSAREAYLELQRLSREPGRGTTQQLLELYLHERFLARLALSEHRERFVLKGGMLLASYELRRPTRDADLLALAIPADDLPGTIAVIARIGLQDGVLFDVDQLASEVVREEAGYPGLRISFPAGLDRARLRLSVDVSVGDRVVPELVELPALLDDEPIRLLGYPIVSVVAEKAETMTALGDANTRVRDFADVLLISMSYPVEAPALRAAIEATAHQRGREPKLLREAIDELGALRQAAWTALRLRQPVFGPLPESFQRVVSDIVAFIDGALDREGAGRWNPDRRTWE